MHVLVDGYWLPVFLSFYGVGSVGGCRSESLDYMGGMTTVLFGSLFGFLTSCPLVCDEKTQKTFFLAEGGKEVKHHCLCLLCISSVGSSDVA